MTDEQINIAIAEVCGWSKDDIERGYTLCQFSENIPDYCNDLNAMHEVERLLGPKDYESFRWILWDICTCSLVSEWKRAHLSATAHQRAEAFLKTIGKWKEQN